MLSLHLRDGNERKAALTQELGTFPAAGHFLSFIHCFFFYAQVAGRFPMHLIHLLATFCMPLSAFFLLRSPFTFTFFQKNSTRRKPYARQRGCFKRRAVGARKRKGEGGMQCSIGTRCVFRIRDRKCSEDTLLLIQVA